ncbi:RluA family pseudouridine synthase [Blastopirellula marina]|uniref:Putative 23S rRNA pseudouridine synthase n=1 Tax=Blastopirellula marina DSM 3645 TaxID=314230 RepID=A4A1L7_9BACT|nr:RNA pseudouridine synthase [Blastopirellula marina]EAQ77322.1 putative 23S rRNA pseudouridine synthase [Blastopirellula marina DSM 3645]
MNEFPPANVDILYEQGPCFCIAKPAGLLTQAPPHIDSLESRFKAFIRQRDFKTGKVYLGVPHRLDRPVSGVLTFARNVRAARRISQQFETRLVRKLYWAFVAGQPPDDQGVWEDPIRKIPDVAMAEIVSPSDPGARWAKLKYEVLQRTEQGAWLEIELDTGRYHQIRVQCASRGFPILGDVSYGGEIPFGPQSEDERARHIALHARYLRLKHPMVDEIVAVTAPLPESWNAIAGWNPEWEDQRVIVDVAP